MPPERVRAFGPGRVNLIGEHTDYNDGLCLPFAIERGVTVTAQAVPGAEVSARALDLGEEDAFPADAPPRPPPGDWRGFVRGVVAELRAAGAPVPGARLEISGDVPRGSGLSSSAALETALALALLALAGAEPVDRRELARLLADVENDWVGAHTGMLDQLAALCGRPGAALRIDMRTLEVRPVPLELGGWTLVTVDSGASRAHGESGYNRRRAECAAACRELGLGSLREATVDHLAALPPAHARRVRHVIEENDRVEAAVAALERGDLEALGPLLDRSHASLRDLYEASVPAVERTVAALLSAGAAGARMVGGGFGGHVLALFPPGRTPPAGSVAVRPGPGAGLRDGPG